MKTVGIADFKARLSAYLESVRRGHTLLVCDRHHPVAKVAPLDDPSDTLLVDEPRRPGPPAALPRVRLRRHVDLDRLLHDERGER